MAQQEQISELISDKVFTDLAKLSEELAKSEQQLIDNVIAAAKFNDALGNSQGVSAITANSNRASQSIDRVAQAQERSRLAEIRLQQQRERSVDTYNRQELAMNRLRAAAENDNREFSLLTARLRDLDRAAQDVGARFGVTSTQFQSASAAANEVRGQVNGIQNGLGNYTNQVGQYTQGIAGYFGKFYGAIRTAANILPGIGIGGIFLLGYEGAVKLYDYLDGKKNAFDSIKDNLANLNEVSKAANKDQAEQIDSLKYLYAAATDVTNSMQLRIRAAKELKDTYPDAFKNSTTQSILNGQEADSFKALSAEIVNNARAKAAKSKIDEIESKILDTEFQQQKIRNANQREIIAATAAAQKDTEELNQRNAANGRDLVGSDFTKNTANALILASNLRAKNTLADQKDKADALNRQKDFLVKYAGGETAIGNALSGNGDNTKPKKDNTPRRDLESELKDLKTSEETILQSQTSSFAERLAAVDAYEKNADKLITAARDKGIIREKDAAARINAIALDATNDRIKIDKDRAAAYSKAQKEEYDAAVAAEKRLEDVYTNQKNARLKQIADEAQAEVMAATEQLQKREINSAEYNQKIYDIEADAAAKRIQIEIDALKKIAEAQAANLTLGVGNSKDLQDTANKIAAFEIQASNLKTKVIVDNAKKQEDALKQLKTKEIELAEATLTLAKTIVDGSFQSAQDRIKDQSTAIDKQAQLDKDAVERSLLTAQQKKDKEAVIDAQAAAQKDVLAQRAKKLAHDQAVADKAFNILSIAGHTALAAVAALAPPPIGLGPLLGIPLAAVISALGAVQIATVLAQPIPAYEKGTKHSKAGYAVVGEKGIERVTEPSGKVWYTPEKPTLVSLVGGSEITNNKELMQEMARPPQFGNIMQSLDLNGLIAAEDRNAKKIVDAINSGRSGSVRTGVIRRNAKYYNGYLKG